MIETDNPKCAICGRKIARGERRVCRRCAVGFTTIRPAKNSRRRK